MIASITNDSSSTLQSLPDCSSTQDDVFTWTLESKRSFSFRFFYKFLMDGGLQSPLYPNFWKVDCPSKITLFYWLASENKISTLTNLTIKGCNIQNASKTCVLCHRNSKTVDHLMIHCAFSERIWSFFMHNINSQSCPHSMVEVWST